MASSQLAEEEKAQGTGVQEECWVLLPLSMACRAGISSSGCCKRALAFLFLAASALHILQKDLGFCSAASWGSSCFSSSLHLATRGERPNPASLPPSQGGNAPQHPWYCARARGCPWGSVSWHCRSFPPLEPVSSSMLGLPCLTKMAVKLEI